MSDDLEARGHHAIARAGETYIKLADASVTFGLYRKDIAAKEAEITRLRAALATARREGEASGIEWGAGMISPFMKIADKMSDGLGLERDPVKAIEFAIARTLEEAAAIRAAAGEMRPGEHLSEAKQERDEFFNRLGRITEYLDLPVDATAQRIIETIRDRVENEREACASVEVRLTVPEGAESWTPLEAWEEALLAFDEAFRDAIRGAAKEEK